MARKKSYPFEPDYAVAPGETLQETIEALGITQTELATRLGMAQKTVNQIIQGAAPIVAETAIGLERATGVPARFWVAHEAGYRARLAKFAERDRLARGQDWAARFPVKELRRRGAIQVAQGVDIVAEVLSFFGVASVEAWEDLWREPAARFRRGKATERACYAVAAWLRLGELEARKVETRAFSKAKLLRALREARALTTADPAEFVPALQARFAEAGVAVVFVPEITGAGVYGATRWLTPEKALIQLSLLRKSDDQLWFSFFHEAGHVLKHGKKERFIESSGGIVPKLEAKEREANEFAADLLIPPEYVAAMRTLRRDAEIAAFARKIGIAPGIVVGRLQHEKLLPFSHGNGLRRRFEWA